MSAQALSDYINENGIRGELIRLEQRASTVEEAANALGVEPGQIVKSVLILADGAPVLAIANGTARIDTRALAAHLGVPRKRVRLADPRTVRDVTGFEVGGVPPFGHREALRTLVDEGVLALDDAFAGGGEDEVVLRVAPAEILRVTGAETVRIGPATR